MNRSTVRIIAGLLALGCLGEFAMSQNLEEVVVKAQQKVKTNLVGKSASGVPILGLSFSYYVSTAGVDLSSHAGVETMKQRVDTAALAACKEISKAYPNATPDDRECAKNAAEEAMKQVHKLARAAKPAE